MIVVQLLIGWLILSVLALLVWIAAVEIGYALEHHRVVRRAKARGGMLQPGRRR